MTATHDVKAMRREFIAEALDGLIFQADGAIRFLERGDDRCAFEAMKRLIRFAKEAAAEMTALRADTSSAPPAPTAEGP